LLIEKDFLKKRTQESTRGKTEKKIKVKLVDLQKRRIKEDVKTCRHFDCKG